MIDVIFRFFEMQIKHHFVNSINFLSPISIIDSTKLVVCHNLRIKRHRVFKGLANRGKSSIGWFYGFKLHILINSLGEIILRGITLPSYS
jgi:hypothetical protein